MLNKLLLLIALVSHAASDDILTVDHIENIRIIESSPGRIVSGWDADPAQFPYQVYLRARNQIGQLLGCGGSIIHELWVLTAAHCTANYLQVTVNAGMIYVSAPQYVGDSWEWYNHPSYVSSQPEAVQPNDVALVRLSWPLTFSDTIKSIKLQSSWDAHRPYDDQQLIASGWGRTWTGGAVPNQLQWTYLRGISDWECATLFGTRIVNANTVCARYFNVTSQSVCQGDSGGPLIFMNNGEPLLAGVTSFVAGATSGGCHSGHPGGFVRPGPFQQWFQQVTGISFDTPWVSQQDLRLPAEQTAFKKNV